MTMKSKQKTKTAMKMIKLVVTFVARRL